jgi:hypothetical protein
MIQILLGGDWNHGILNDFPILSHHIGNGIIIPTDFHSIIFQRGRAKNHHAAYRFPELAGSLAIPGICCEGPAGFQIFFNPLTMIFAE